MSVVDLLQKVIADFAEQQQLMIRRAHRMRGDGVFQCTLSSETEEPVWTYLPVTLKIITAAKKMHPDAHKDGYLKLVEEGLRERDPTRHCLAIAAIQHGKDKENTLSRMEMISFRPETLEESLEPANVTEISMEEFRESLRDKCSVCNSTKKLQKCKACYSVFYCSTKCQRQDRKKHKEQCQSMSSFQQSAMQEHEQTARLSAKKTKANKKKKAKAKEKKKRDKECVICFEVAGAIPLPCINVHPNSYVHQECWDEAFKISGCVICRAK